MSAVDLEFANALNKLRTLYVVRLRESGLELRKFALLCELGGATAEADRAIRTVVHKLSGSGATLGYPEISATAIALETVLDGDPPFPPASVADLTHGLLRACEAAIASTKNAEASQARADNGSAGSPSKAENIAAEIPPASVYLAVHDDPAMARLFDDVFCGKVKVDTASCGAEALSYLGSHRPDLIIIDLEKSGLLETKDFMPIYNAAMAGAIPVVVLTYSRRSAAVVRAIDPGSIDCLMKPIDRVRLYETTQQVLERRRLVVLLGDDDRLVRELLKHRFEASGFQVHTANDGEQVLALAKLHRPSIIVLDRAMPGLEGLAVLRMLKDELSTGEIPVIILSGKRLPHEISEGRRSGALDYMLKPFSPDQVVTRCIRALGMEGNSRSAERVPLD